LGFLPLQFGLCLRSWPLKLGGPSLRFLQGGAFSESFSEHPIFAIKVLALSVPRECRFSESYPTVNIPVTERALTEPITLPLRPKHDSYA
jgi:hypothetical protein